jgi:acyl carrier protein
MGLDVVEIVLRCEEEFGVELENDRLEQIHIVGDLFELICERLKLPSGPGVPRSARRLLIPDAIASSEELNRDAVWLKLVAILTDQLQVEPDEIQYSASFSDDLGAD